MSKRAVILWIALAAIATLVGGGLARAGVIELEGDIRLTIRPSPEAVIKGGPIGGPYSTSPFSFNEPATLEFFACCVFDPEGGTVTAEWDLDYNGITFDVDANGEGPVSHTYPDGPYSTYVGLRLTSTTGAVGIVTAPLTIVNVPPTATAGGPYTGAAGSAVTFNGNATDPSTPDTNSGFTFAWDFDYRGTFQADATGHSLKNPTFAYPQAGTYTVAVRATDKDNGVSNTATAQVVISGAVTLNSIADTMIVQNLGTSNYGTLSSMDVQSLTSSQNRRALVGFDLSSLPANATIVTASLRIYMATAPTSQRTLELRAPTAGWTETAVTWATIPATDPTAMTTTTAPTTAGWITFNVAGSVQDMIKGLAPNYGWMAQDSVESASSPGFKEVLVTREGTSGQRPELQVTYTVPGAP